jgi:glycosyltransferase involved in cell wall biosynthesis
MRAFSLNKIPEFSDSVSLENWPIELAKLGIGIAPLADTLFNSRKSWLKPLELNACGVPFVASPREEYKRLVDRGAGGLLAKKPKDWHRQLTRLTSDEQFRKALSATGREFAKTMVIEDHAELWLEAWNRAYEIQRKSVKVSV